MVTYIQRANGIPRLHGTLFDGAVRRLWYTDGAILPPPVHYDPTRATRGSRYAGSQVPVPTVRADEQTDDDLVLGMAAGDANALASFEAFYDRHHRAAFALAYRILNADRTLAEDTVQEAFLALWRYAASFTPARGNARTWFLSIAHHRALNAIRRTKGWRSEDSLDGVMERPASDETYDVWTQVTRDLDAAQVGRALNDLPQEQREAIALSFLGGLSNTEVATRLGVPLGTIKSRIRLGMHKMRAMLAPVTLEQPRQ